MAANPAFVPEGVTLPFLLPERCHLYFTIAQLIYDNNCGFERKLFLELIVYEILHI